MIDGWGGQLLAFAAALALLVVPGLPTALLLRLRGVLLVAAAIVGSLACVGAGALIAPLVGMSWSLLPVILVSLVITAIAAALWMLRREAALPLCDAGDRWVWAGVGAAVVGWAMLVIAGIRGASNPTQLYDGLFHLNAVEFILTTGDASPFHMTMVVPGAAVSFYPTLWHAMASLLVPLAGGVVQATNVLTISVIALIWPVALAALAVVLFPKHPKAAVWAPLTAFGFSVFPLGFLNWGVLYPNLLGVVQIPVLIALVLLASQHGLPPSQRIGAVLLATAAAGSTALGHPSALLAAVALLLPYAAWRVLRVGATLRPRGRVLLALGSAVVMVALAALWFESNVTTNEWLPGVTMAQAVGEVAFLSPVGRATGLLIGPLAAVGVWAAVRSRVWWLLASYAVAFGFYLASAWLPILPLRSSIVGVWYDDTTRVGALIAVFGLPLAALGAVTVVEWLRALAAHGHRVLTALLVAVIAVLGATHLTAVVNEVSYMRNVSFRFDDASQGLTPDEADLLEKADDILRPDSVVIGDPLTGAGLLYAYTGHTVVFPHVTGDYGSDAEVLARKLSTGPQAQVCLAVERLGVTHAIDFGDRELFENHYTTFDGLHDLMDSPLLTQVARVGDAALYEVTGCR